MRDWIEAPAIAESITLKRGFTGAKPAAVTWWIFDWLNMEEGDEFVDLFPGSGAVGEAHRAWLEAKSRDIQLGMFGEAA